ncbi:MAG TPA: three-Cys-motif partner protein TcmP [Pyrinomonadaceae bacterium]|jgi:three-Cys-motif partner protein
MSKNKFFKGVKPWSKRKHRILGKYLPPFTAKVASRIRQREIFCIDGFAGSAKYEDNQAGSPLITAQFSDKCSNWTDPVTLKIINVEAKRKNFISLRLITQRWEEKGIVININKKFNDSVSEILKIIGDAPALFFIDPFGPTDIHFSCLEPILRRSQQMTELIINFDVDGLRRIIDAAFSYKTETTVAEKQFKHAVEVLGSQSCVEKLKDSTLSTEEREQIILNHYEKRLTRFGYKVLSYPIRENDLKTPKYYIICCTRHEDGVKLLNNFFRQEEDDLIKESYSPDSNPRFPEFDITREIKEERQQTLRNLLPSFLLKNRKTTRKQIMYHFIEKHFGDFDDKDYRAVVQELIDSEILVAEHGKKKINDDVLLTYLG